MKRVVIFFLVFVVAMFASNALLESNDTNALFIKLLFSGLIASIVFWLSSVRDEQGNRND
jgi:amino acid permease